MLYLIDIFNEGGGARRVCGEKCGCQSIQMTSRWHCVFICVCGYIEKYRSQGVDQHTSVVHPFKHFEDKDSHTPIKHVYHTEIWAIVFYDTSQVKRIKTCIRKEAQVNLKLCSVFAQSCAM